MIDVKKIIFFLLCVSSLGSCWYNDSDRIDPVADVVGNIRLVKQRNNDGVDLVFADSPNVNSVIVDGCIAVYYDSIQSKMLVEEYGNEFSNEYYRIEIKDIRGKNKEALKKKAITKDQFESDKKKIKGKRWEFIKSML